MVSTNLIKMASTNHIQLLALKTLNKLTDNKVHISNSKQQH